MTMYDYRTNLSNEVYNEVKKFFEDKVYENTIPRNIRLAESPSFWTTNNALWWKVVRVQVLNSKI